MDAGGVKRVLQQFLSTPEPLRRVQLPPVIFISQPPGIRGESERMYKVMCRGSRRAWADYSGKFETMEQAEECKERAEKRRACDIHGKEIEYKIFAI